MKYWISFIILAMTVFAELPKKADDITLEFLANVAKETGYCDPVPHIQKIFENYKVKTMLEFGLGLSTKYFLDNCNKVISVEFITGYETGQWLKYTLALYQNYSNWVPIAYFSNYHGNYTWAPYKFFGTTKLFEAEQVFRSTCQLHFDEILNNELQTFIGNLTKYNHIDLVLVDPPSLLRGMLVQQLFNKCSIILTNDCSSFINQNVEDIYGYKRIVVPENYETIFIPYGKQTLLWIEKNEKTQALIHVMKEYVSTL